MHPFTSSSLHFNSVLSLKPKGDNVSVKNGINCYFLPNSFPNCTNDDVNITSVDKDAKIGYESDIKICNST